jgi:hypothetical protein
MRKTSYTTTCQYGEASLPNVEKRRWFVVVNVLLQFVVQL